MNVTQKEIDSVNVVLSVEVNRSDYAEAVEKELKQYRRKASVPGFRPGMVPISLLRKMVGEKITADVVNQEVGKALYNYISEQKLNVLGEPMLVGDQEPVDFKTEETFTVSFDVALAPTFELTLDKNVQIPHYRIIVSDDMLNSRIEGYRSQYGTTVDGEEVMVNDVIAGSVVELDAEGNVLEGGVTAAETNLYPRYFSDETEKAKFIGAKVGATVDFCPAVAAGGNTAEIASMLQVDDKKAETLKGNFRFTIQQISHLEKAELGEELFHNVFGEECSTEEDFRAAVRAKLASQWDFNCVARFASDVRKTLMAQVGTLTFPEETLKRWLLTKENHTDAAKLDEEMPDLLKSLTWQLVEEKIIADYNLVVTDEDIRKAAIDVFFNRMRQYGFNEVSKEQATAYASTVIKDEKQRSYYRDIAVTNCIMAKVQELVTLEEKEITPEELVAMSD